MGWGLASHDLLKKARPRPLILAEVFRESINDRLITSDQLSTQCIGQGLLNNLSGGTRSIPTLVMS